MKTIAAIMVPGVGPVQVPNRSVAEIAKELEACRLTNDGYHIYAIDPELKGSIAYIPSWMIQQINVVILQMLDKPNIQIAKTEISPG